MIERLLAADEALARGELDVAERLFNQVADADARNAIAVVGLARVAVRRDEPGRARELAGRALVIDGDEAAAVRLIAELETAASGPATTPVPAAPAGATPGPRRGLRAWLARLLRRS